MFAECVYLFVYGVSHWDNIVRKVLSKVLGLEKR